YPYDPTKAATALRAAGVPEGTSFTILVQTIPEMTGAAEAVQAQLKAVGIDAKLNPTANLAEGLAQKPDVMVASSANAELPATFLVSGAVFNFGYTNPTYDEVFNKSMGSIDKATADQINREAQEILVEDLPMIFLAQEPVSIGMAENVEGLGVL